MAFNTIRLGKVKWRLLAGVVAALAMLGCQQTAQTNDVESLTSAVAECIWSEAHAEDSTGISNEWLKDKVLMDFLHASNLGSENLLQEAAKNEVLGYDTLADLRLSLISTANNEYVVGTPAPSFLAYVPHPRAREEQGRLTVLYLHLFHCRDYWQGATATKVLKYDDELADLSECYWQQFRIEESPLPGRSSGYMQTAKRPDYVSAFQLDGVFRVGVSRFKDMTPEKMTDTIKSRNAFCG